MKGQTRCVVFTAVSSSALYVVVTILGQAIISSYLDHGNSLQTSLSTSTLPSVQYILRTAPTVSFKMQILFCYQPSYNPSVIPHWRIHSLRRIEPKSQTWSPSQPATLASFRSSCHTLCHLLPTHPFIYLIPSCP